MLINVAFYFTAFFWKQCLEVIIIHMDLSRLENNYLIYHLIIFGTSWNILKKSVNTFGNAYNSLRKEVSIYTINGKEEYPFGKTSKMSNCLLAVKYI